MDILLVTGVYVAIVLYLIARGDKPTECDCHGAERGTFKKNWEATKKEIIDSKSRESPSRENTSEDLT